MQSTNYCQSFNSIKSEDKIKNFKIKLIRKLPFYGDVVLRLGFYEKKEIPTACTDGKNIYYNPLFFEKLTEGQRNYIFFPSVQAVGISFFS